MDRPNIKMTDVLQHDHPLYPTLVWWDDEHGRMGASLQGTFYPIYVINNYKSRSQLLIGWRPSDEDAVYAICMAACGLPELDDLQAAA